MKDHAYRPFLLTLFVILLLTLAHFLPALRIGDTELRRIDLLSDLSTDSTENDFHDVIPKPKEPGQLLAKNKEGKTVTFKEIWPKGVQRIVDFSGGESGGMEHFYAMLDSVKHKQLKGRPLRIAYFGDSFIEGDILVCDLRELMQKRFGGWGVGWIDAGNDLTKYKRTINSTFTGLEEHMAMKKESYNAREAGIAQRYYTMMGKVKLTYAGTKDFPHTTRWSTSRLYFRSPNGITFSGHEGAKSFILPFKGEASVQVAEMRGITSSADFVVAKGSATLFGTALESDGGVIIDNFSLRGASGQTLADLPETTLKEFSKTRPYDLIIIQYGVNAVTEKSTASQLKTYMKEMRKVVEHLKRGFPQASILVAGAPDRGSKTAQDGTMPAIKMLSGLQEQLASDTKVGFLSILGAMGGPGTMRRIVDEHGWGSKDYVHINWDGGKFVANRLFKSFLCGYDNYVRRKKIENQ